MNTKRLLIIPLALLITVSCSTRKVATAISHLKSNSDSVVNSKSAVKSQTITHTTSVDTSKVTTKQNVTIEATFDPADTTAPTPQDIIAWALPPGPQDIIAWGKHTTQQKESIAKLFKRALTIRVTGDLSSVDQKFITSSGDIQSSIDSTGNTKAKETKSTDNYTKTKDTESTGASAPIWIALGILALVGIYLVGRWAVKKWLL